MSLAYRPEQHEQPYYLAMFKIADIQGRGNIGGAEAVKFFGRSKLPIETLKNIWTVADQPSTSSLDLKKFAVAVRLIQLTQNGQKGKGANLDTPSGVVLKPVFFEGVSGVTVRMPPVPPQGGMPPPHPTPQQANRAMPPPQQQTYRAQTPPGSVVGSQPSSPVRSVRQAMQLPPQQQYQQAPPTPSRALVGMDPYTLTPQERQRYEGLFPTYAKTEEDGSKFVYGSEAVPLFMKSGVDPTSLREIWNMVDRNPVDNRLDSLEFAMAMHLIVCVSKKNLPMPSGGTLPNSLLALVANAPALGAPPQQQQQMPPSQGFGAGGPPQLGGADSGIGGMNISDAFEGMSTMGSVTDQSQPAPAPEAHTAIPSYVPTAAPTPAVVPEPPTPQPHPTYVVQPQSLNAAVAPTPPAPAPVATTSVETYQVSDSHLEELNKLKSVLQKLQAENISLKAQLGNMTDEEKHVHEELGQTITEITALSTDLGLQRQQVLDAKNSLLEAKAELKSQRETKGVLTGLISEAKETADAIGSATETLRATVETQNSVPPAPLPEAQDLFDMGYSNPVGTAPPAPENAPLPSQQGLDGFANEQEMSGGVTSLPTPSPQPAREFVAPGSTPQEQQQFSIPEPSGQGEYSNYAAPAPPQAGGYPASAPMPPQQDAGGYPGQAPMPPQQEAGGYPAAGGYSAQAPMPPQQEAGGYPAAGDYSAQAPMPPQQSGSYPSQSPVPQRQAAAPGHVRNPSSGFGEGFLMGGSAEAIPQDTSRDNDNFSVAARSMASTGGYGYDDQAFEAVEGMKKKAKIADGAARDAEAAHRKLADEADELRTDADRAEANARSLAAAPGDKSKKKGRFGGDKKKKKKVKEEADQAAKDAALIKSHFMSIQSQSLETQSVAAQRRAQADRYRDEAEAAELDMAAAASKKQRQPAPEPAPAASAPSVYNAPPQHNYGGIGAAPQQQPYQGQAPQYGMPNGGPTMMPQNGDGYNNYAQPVNGMGADAYGQQQQQAYGGPPPQQQQAYGGPPPQQQQAYGGPPQMSLPDPSKMAPGAMDSGGYGGYGMPPPNEYGQMAPAPAAPANGGDPYMSPY